MHWFLAQNTDRSALSRTFDTEIGLCGSHGTEKKPVDGEVANLFGGLWTAAVPLWLRFQGGNKGDAEKYCMQVYGEGLDGRPWK